MPRLGFTAADLRKLLKLPADAQVSVGLPASGYNANRGERVVLIVESDKFQVAEPADCGIGKASKTPSAATVEELAALLREATGWLEDPSAYAQDDARGFDERVGALLARLPLEPSHPENGKVIVEELARALLRYGRHDDTCSGGPACRCGWPLAAISAGELLEVGGLSALEELVMAEVSQDEDLVKRVARAIRHTPASDDEMDAARAAIAVMASPASGAVCGAKTNPTAKYSCTLPPGHGGDWHDDGKRCWPLEPSAPASAPGGTAGEAKTTLCHELYDGEAEGTFALCEEPATHYSKCCGAKCAKHTCRHGRPIVPAAPPAATPTTTKEVCGPPEPEPNYPENGGQEGGLK